MAKTHNHRSEVAQREACRLLRRGEATKSFACYEKPFEIHVYKDVGKKWEKVAIFDLRDCYRKRRPLKGVTKAMRKAIAGKGSTLKK